MLAAQAGTEINGMRKQAKVRKNHDSKVLSGLVGDTYLLNVLPHYPRERWDYIFFSSTALTFDELYYICASL